MLIIIYLTATLLFIITCENNKKYIYTDNNVELFCYILSYKNEKYNITIEMLLRHNKGLYRTTLNFVKF